MAKGEQTMNVRGNTSTARNATSAETGRASQSVGGRFCPHGGFVPHSSVQFNEEVRWLLGIRLRTAATIGFGGFAAFLVRNLLIGAHDEVGGMAVLVPHAIVTVVIGITAVLLFKRSCLSLRQLRWLELVLFGLSAAFFVWRQFCLICDCPAETLKAAAASYPAETILPWIILIHVYGLFIPNTWRRACSVVALMAAAPLVGAIAAAVRQPLVADSLRDGGLSAMALWLGIACVTAIYGSNRFGRLRRAAFDAKNVGIYTLRQKLGVGGMGEVYLAEHQLLKRPCAIKLIRPDKADDPTAIARFESEVQTTARLTHPNTIEVYDYGYTQDGTFFYAMEFLPGLNLQEMVDRYGPLPPERVVHLLRQVCSALREAHAVGLIHRDIKPGNIFATERGGIYDVAKLLDFGLVKSLNLPAESLKLSIDGTVVGSPLYAPPERTLGEDELDARGDVYSLGATAYFLLTGRPVFSGDNPLKVLFAHANDTPTAPTEYRPGIPAQLEAIVMKCLEKKPDDRFPDISQLEQAFAACRRHPQWTQDQAVAWWSETEDMTVAATARFNDTNTQILGVDA